MEAVPRQAQYQAQRLAPGPEQALKNYQ